MSDIVTQSYVRAPRCTEHVLLVDALEHWNTCQACIDSRHMIRVTIIRQERRCTWCRGRWYARAPTMECSRCGPVSR